MNDNDFYFSNKGDFTIIKMHSNISSNILSVTIQKPLGKFIPPIHSFMAKIHPEKIPSKILENGKAVSMILKTDIDSKTGWYYDENEKLLWIRSVGKNTGDNEWQVSLKN